MEINIKVFEPPYDKKEFYGYMGDVLCITVEGLSRLEEPKTTGFW